MPWPSATGGKYSIYILARTGAMYQEHAVVVVRSWVCCSIGANVPFSVRVVADNAVFRTYVGGVKILLDFGRSTEVCPSGAVASRFPSWIGGL